MSLHFQILWVYPWARVSNKSLKNISSHAFQGHPHSNIEKRWEKSNLPYNNQLRVDLCGECGKWGRGFFPRKGQELLKIEEAHGVKWFTLCAWIHCINYMLVFCPQSLGYTQRVPLAGHSLSVGYTSLPSLTLDQRMRRTHIDYNGITLAQILCMPCDSLKCCHCSWALKEEKMEAVKRKFHLLEFYN